MTNKFKRSLLPEALRGVVLVYTGQAGAGKSIGSLLDPNHTVFIDADHRKGQELAKAKPKMIYRPINSEDGENLVLTGENFLAAITDINKDKTTVVVFDNLHEIEQGLHAYALANPVKLAKMYNLIAGNITSKAYGHDSMAHERIIKGVVDELLANDITVVITTHMKPKFMVTGQLEIKARRWIYEAASLVGIMVRTAEAPDMLIFKNAFSYHVAIDTDTLSDQQFEQYRRGELSAATVYQRIPRRIPAYTPSVLFSYLARTPKEISSTPYNLDEILDEDEMAPYLEILTKDQRANVDKIMEREEEERKRSIAFEDNLKESQRVELDKAIADNMEMEVSKLLAMLKTDFSLFASEITPIYIMTVKQRG